MQTKRLDARLAEMARVHGTLIERARRTTCHCCESVLNLGAAVASHAACTTWLHEQMRILDEAVLEELSGERRRLADDLDLLESLEESSPGSPDIETLATALVIRMQQLLERERRVLYQPLLRLASGLESES